MLEKMQPSVHIQLGVCPTLPSHPTQSLALANLSQSWSGWKYFSKASALIFRLPVKSSNTSGHGWEDPFSNNVLKAKVKPIIEAEKEAAASLYLIAGPTFAFPLKSHL